jgi:hypothetical protein
MIWVRGRSAESTSLLGHLEFCRSSEEQFREADQKIVISEVRGWHC